MMALQYHHRQPHPHIACVPFCVCFFVLAADEEEARRRSYGKRTGAVMGMPEDEGEPVKH